MKDIEKQAHWRGVYSTKQPTEVSWFEQVPDISLQLIADTGLDHSTSIIDIGGGTSLLVDCLLDKGYKNLSVLDISQEALNTAKARLGVRGNCVRWISTDICNWKPEATSIDIWHDRATFHFLTDDADRTRYITAMKMAVKKGAYVIIGTFALDGPEKCSGLQVRRYDPVTLAQTLGSDFSLLKFIRHSHTTPWGSHQSFQFSTFKRA